jgi:CBS domain-containing protein
VERIAQLMVEEDINRVPVVEEGKLAGIISRADVIRYIAKTLD